jgi:hypothetical protein
LQKGAKTHVVLFGFVVKKPKIAINIKIKLTLQRERGFKGPGRSQNEPLGPPRSTNMVQKRQKNGKHAKRPRGKRNERASEQR